MNCFKFVVLLFCLLMVAPTTNAKNPLSRFIMMKKTSSKNESSSKMKRSLHFGLFGRKNSVNNAGSESSDSSQEETTNKLNLIAARAKEEALNAFGKELDDAQASHTGVSKNQTEAAVEEKVKDLESELSAFRAVATSHLTRLIEEANRHQTQQIAAVVQDYDQRFSDMQRLSESALMDANAAIAQKEAALAALTAELDARNVELEIQLKRAEEVQENATRAEQESIARMNDLERQLQDLQAITAAEMEHKEHELTALKIAYDDKIDTVKKELEQQAAKGTRTENAESINQLLAREADVNWTQRIAAMADAQVHSEQALVAVHAKLAKREEELVALKIQNDQLLLKQQYHQQPLKLAENTGEMALESVLNAQKECEDLLSDTKTKVDEITKEANKRVAEIENEHAQRLAEAQARASKDLADADHELAMKEEELAVLRTRYEEQRSKNLAQVELTVAERDAAVEAEQRATMKILELEHASQVLLSETTFKFEQRINEIEATATQGIIILTDECEQSELALTAAHAELKEKEKIIAALKRDYVQLKYQDEKRLELPESARNDALERVQYLQQECETLLEKTRVEMTESTRAAEEHLSQIANKMDKDFAQRLTAAQEQAKHDLADAKGASTAKEKELAALLAENGELKTAETNGKRRIVELERNARRRLDDANSYFLKELDNAKAEAAKKEAQLTALMAEYDFVAFATRTDLEKAEAECNVAVEEMNKALQIVKDLEDETLLVETKLAKEESTLAALKADFDRCEAKSQKQLKIINDARITAFQTKKEFDGKVALIEQEKEMALAKLKVEFESCKTKSQKQLKIINDARTTAFQTKKDLDGKLEQIEQISRLSKEERIKDAQKLAQVEQDYIRRLTEVQTRSEETLAEVKDTLEKTEHELATMMSEYAESSERDKEQLGLALAAVDAAVEAKDKALYTVRELELSSEALLSAVLASKCDDGQALYDERFASSGKQVKMREEELETLDENYDEAETRYLHDDATRLEVEKNKEELAAEYADTQFRSTAKTEAEKLETELMSFKGESGSQEEGLHRIEVDVHASFKDSSETSVVLFMSEEQTTTDDQDVQSVDTIAAQSSPPYKRRLVYFLFERIENAFDFAFSFFLNCFDSTVLYVRIHCQLFESDMEVTSPSWIQESVREACQEPREAVACFFQVVCMSSAFLMRRLLWRLLWRTFTMSYFVISLFSPTSFIGSSGSKNSAIQESTLHVGRRLRGSPKKRAL